MSKRSTSGQSPAEGIDPRSTTITTTTAAAAKEVEGGKDALGLEAATVMDDLAELAEKYKRAQNLDELRLLAALLEADAARSRLRLIEANAAIEEQRQSVHHWWSVAEERQALWIRSQGNAEHYEREARAWSEVVAQLQGSRSWRYTAWLRRGSRGDR